MVSSIHHDFQQCPCSACDVESIYCRGSDWRSTSKQFNKDDITTYKISCFLLPIYDIQMLIKSVVWQELSSHRGALQCQMANVQKRLRFQVQIFDQSTALAIFRGKAAYEATSCFIRELPGLLQHEEAVNQQRRQQAQAGNETLLI